MAQIEKEVLIESSGVSTDQAIKLTLGKQAFQILLLILVCFSFSTGGQISYSLPFLQAKDHDVKFYCYFTNGTEGLCDAKTACDSAQTSHFDYLHNTDQTLVNWIVDFQLACDSDQSISLQGTYFFAGFLVSAAVFPTLSDILGRKPIILAGLLFHIAINLAIQYWHNRAFLIAYLVLLGIRLPMASHTAFLLLAQYSPPLRRALFANLVSAFDGGFTIIIALGFYYLRDWTSWFFIVDAQNLLLFFFFLIFIPESPRYLIARRKFYQAHKAFARVARCNRSAPLEKSLEGENKHTSSLSDHATSQMSISKPKQHPFIALCKQGNSVRLRLAVLFILFFIVDIEFYGISFGLDHLRGNKYANGILVGCSDIVSCTLLGLVADKFGRKKAMLICSATLAVSALVYDLVSSYEILSYVLIVITRMGAASSFALMFLLAQESYPTEVRGTVFGIANAFARVGGAVAPLASTIPHFMIILSALGAIAFLLTLIMKETKGEKMEDYVIVAQSEPGAKEIES